MKEFRQETDSIIVFNLSPKRSSHKAVKPFRETRVSAPNKTYVTPPENSSLIGRAWCASSKAKNLEVVKQARKLLLIIQEIIFSFEQLDFRFGALPSFRAVEEDDESVLIEWIFPNYRIGFTIEPNPSDSGWYLVSSQALNEASASGRLSGANMKKNILWLFNFVLSHR